MSRTNPGLNGYSAGDLTPGQDAVCNVLARMLAAAKRGELDAIAVVCVSADGALLTDFKGTLGFECQLNMGLDHVKDGVKRSFLQAQLPPSAIIRPDLVPLG